MADSFYNKWCSMKRRCDNQNVWNYKNYGGRGIKYDERWFYFKLFKNDMFESYKNCGLKNPTLDRIDNNCDYSKENCRWVDYKSQANNRRTNRFVSYDGKRMTLSEWSEYSGVKYSTLKQRFYCLKLSFDKCIKKGHLRWQTAMSL